MRINEDYIDIIDRDNIVDDDVLSMDVYRNVEWLCNGHHTNIDFNIIDSPIYKVTERNELEYLISKTIEAYGDDCNLNWIDVSEIDDMCYLFKDFSKFNGDISGWNVSHVTDMSYMFYGSFFNGDISDWNVSKVDTMEGMFQGSKFDGNISGWDVSHVTDMRSMFQGSCFTGELSGWDVSHVTVMQCMFQNS